MAANIETVRNRYMRLMDLAFERGDEDLAWRLTLRGSREIRRVQGGLL